MNISFCLSEISKGESRTKKRTRHQESKDHGVDIDSPLLDDYDLANGARLCMSQPTLGTLQTFDTGLEEYRSASQPVYLSDEDLLDGLYSPGHCINSFQSTLSNPGEATNPISGSGWVRKTARKRRADDELLDAGLGLHQLVKLTDIALRTLICDNRMSAPVGIKCLSKSVGPKLSEIAPALFSPGYHYVIPKSVLESSSTSLTLRCVGYLATQSFSSSDSSYVFMHAATDHLHFTQKEARLRSCSTGDRTDTWRSSVEAGGPQPCHITSG